MVPTMQVCTKGYNLIHRTMDSVQAHMKTDIKYLHIYGF